jgi:hypothetical protein
VIEHTDRVRGAAGIQLRQPNLSVEHATVCVPSSKELPP